jgi:hypothetical protein
MQMEAGREEESEKKTSYSVFKLKIHRFSSSCALRSLGDLLIPPSTIVKKFLRIVLALARSLAFWFCVLIFHSETRIALDDDDCFVCS